MKLTREQLVDLKGKSPEGIYQHIRQFVRQELGVVDKDELSEAVDDAIRAGLLDEDDLRKLGDDR